MSTIISDEMPGESSPDSVLAPQGFVNLGDFKLPDSIRSSVARSAHDFYVETKHTELGRRKTHLKRMGSPKTKGRNGAVVATARKPGNGAPAEASQSAPSLSSERADVDRGSKAPPTPQACL